MRKAGPYTKKILAILSGLSKSRASGVMASFVITLRAPKECLERRD